MIHLPDLIADLGVILATAAVVTLLFRQLRQPVVLGYIIAGFLIGPHFPFFLSIRDEASVKVWAEIGVIFLLFSLGLEFSFKKLARVGKSASITALFEIATMIGLGYLTGSLMGWSKMDSLFLGGILAISSTTIILRAFDELNLKGRRFVSLVFGILIAEDVAAILLLVLLSTVAVTQSLSGFELASSSVKLSFFLIVWFLIGIYVLPIFLGKVRRILTDETALVFSIGLCLVMVMLATHVGFSPALGAFVTGSLLAETREGKRIEHLIVPVRDLFAAVFFVSVGMLLDPAVLADYGAEVAIITFITIVGKFLGSAIGALLSGQSLRHSVQVGMSLAQIGEFSFIIATLGLTLKVTSDFLYPIAVVVSALTTFLTPYMIRLADPFNAWLNRKLPVPLLQALTRYQASVQYETGHSSLGSLLWRIHGVRILFNGVLVVAIGLSLEQFVFPYVFDYLGEAPWVPAAFSVLSVMLSAPFLWAIFTHPRRESAVPGTVSAQEWNRVSRLAPGITLIKGLFGFGFTLFLIHVFHQLSGIVSAVVMLVLVGIALSSQWARSVYQSIANRFHENLDGGHMATATPTLAPWNASLAEYTLSADSPLVGKTLMESKLKETYGVTVSMIERGRKRILAPGRHHTLMPFDRLALIGEDEQLLGAQKLIEETDHSDHSTDHKSPSAHFGLGSIALTERNRYVGKSVRECGLREDVSGLIVGVERGHERILNPDSGLILQAGDLIWIVGELDKIRRQGIGSKNPS